MKDAWPEVLGRLESASRSSWLIASGARVAELEGDVLTLSFQSQSDVAKFKKLSAGAGPSEDLRQAILAVIGIRVKYLAKHDSEAGPPTPSTSAVARAVARPPHPEPSRSAPAGAARAAAAAPVTEWVVAAIPSDADAPPGGRARAAERAVRSSPSTTSRKTPRSRAHVATLAPPREGEVLPARGRRAVDRAGRRTTSMDAETDAPVPPVVAPPMPSAATRPAPGGTQRYGEAVVRQVLGARFVREEPYEPPTRFS